MRTTIAICTALMLLPLGSGTADADGKKRKYGKYGTSGTYGTYRGYRPYGRYGTVRVYGYGPVYSYLPTAPVPAAPKPPDISGYGPSYAPGFGAGYYSQGVKMYPNAWVERRRWR